MSKATAKQKARFKETVVRLPVNPKLSRLVESKYQLRPKAPKK